MKIVNCLMRPSKYQLTIVFAGCFLKYLGFIQIGEEDRLDAGVGKFFCFILTANQDRQLAALDGFVVGFVQLS